MLLLSTTIHYIRTRLGHLRTREDGVTAVEYALMVAIVAILLVVGFYALFSSVQDAFTETSDCVAGGGDPAACPDAPPP